LTCAIGAASAALLPFFYVPCFLSFAFIEMPWHEREDLSPKSMPLDFNRFLLNHPATATGFNFSASIRNFGRSKGDIYPMMVK
jgi:hypothetical protein